MTIAGNITANYISVNDLHTLAPELYTSISGIYNEVTLSGIITQASARVDQYLGYTLPIETIANEKNDGLVDSGANLVIYTRKRPIENVTGVDLRKGNDVITLSLTSSGNDKFDIPEPKVSFIYPNAELSTSSVSTIANFFEIRDNKFYTITDYRAGYETIPQTMKEATLLYVREILGRRLNTAGASSISQGSLSITYSQRDRKSVV